MNRWLISVALLFQFCFFWQSLCFINSFQWVTGSDCQQVFFECFLTLSLWNTQDFPCGIFCSQTCIYGSFTHVLCALMPMWGDAAAYTRGHRVRDKTLWTGRQAITAWYYHWCCFLNCALLHPSRDHGWKIASCLTLAHLCKCLLMCVVPANLNP